MNKNWKTHWKALSLTKTATDIDHFQYCVLKALTAKSNAKIEIAQALLRRQFPPVTNTTKLENGRTPFDTVSYLTRWHPSWFKARGTVFGMDKSLFFNEESEQAYINLVTELASLSPNIRANEPEYMFIFVRQDISKEQQAVQAAHVAYKAGCMYGYNPDETYFVLVGVEDEAALNEAKATLDIKDVSFEQFYEPDLGDSLTAVASVPIKEHRKRFLKHYQKLVF
jgi:hypothetical protein